MDLISKELSKRQQRVEDELVLLQDEALKRAQELLTVLSRIELVEKAALRHEKELHELKELSRSLQQQYDRFGEKIDKLESKLFSWMQQLQRDNAELIKAAQTEGALERQTTLKSWMTFLQYVLGGTIFIIVAYVFGVNFIR